MSYDFIDQNIVASCLIQGRTDDSFYNPVVNSHTGYAFDGNYYSVGAIVNGHQQASWFTEYGTNTFRGDQAAFPSYGLVLLSPVSLVILDQGTAVAQATSLPLWMQFVLGDNNALANNFNGSEQGWTPSAVCYADGIVSVTYTPDSGNQESFNHINATPPPAIELIVPPYTTQIPPYPAVSAYSFMVVSIDFVQDSVYLDVAI